MKKNSGNTMTALGVKRPIFIAVVNILILLAGAAAFLGIDVRELPDVDRPIVTVRATYDGASPETMDAEVTSIVEGAVSRVSGIKSIESSSEENNMRMRAEFQPNVDLNDAASDVREAVSRVQRELPDDIDQLLVIKADDDAQAIIQIAAYSDTLSKQDLAERIEKDVAPEFLSIEGVADVTIEGEQPSVLRVQININRLNAYGLSITDIIDTLREIQFDVPAGSYKSDSQELIVRAYASVVEPEQIERVYITDDVRLGDVANIFYAPMQAESYTLLNGRMVIGMGIVRQAGSNTISISQEVKSRLNVINERGDDYTLSITSDDAQYIQGALNEVLISLGFATLIVLMVIALFLGQWKATLIPAVTMPISIIGTLAAIWALGFSINLLTLMALVLATGLIVDDAIIVLENIQRLRAQGKPKMAAAVLGTRQVFFAVIATTATLVAVFVPIAFLPGETGRLFREFGIVLAIAVMISSFVAVTVCPMMASRLPDLSKTTPFIGQIQRHLTALGDIFRHHYFKSLDVMLAHKLVALVAFLCVTGFGISGFFTLNQELLPQEDRGAINIFLTGPDGASLAYSDQQAQYVENILMPYKDQGLVKDVYSIIGRWDKNRVFIVATLSDWGQRDISQMDLAAQIDDKLKNLPGAQVRVIQGSSLNTRGGGAGVEIALLGNDYDSLVTVADDFSKTLKENISQIDNVRVQFDTSQPELSFDINRERASDLGVPLTQISQILRVMVNEFDVIDLSVRDQAIPIMVAPTDGAIKSAPDLLNIYVRSNSGGLVPLSSIVSLREQGVAAELDRHAQRRAIELDIGVAPGVPLGDVVAQVKAQASDNLPSGVSILLLGEAATLEESNYEVAVTFILALLVVFLVLAAQFESIGSAFIVIVTVPFGLAAAVFALMLSGQSVNLFSQIGFVMLIGLMTKNAILLVEFMDQLRDEGHDVPTAIREAVQIRLRPLVMTALSTILGSLPLILSSGPGAEARAAIGWVVFGGLGLSTLFVIYLAPLAYAFLAPLSKPRSSAGDRLDAQLQEVEDLERER